MNNNTFKMLEFDKIKENIITYAVTDEAKNLITVMEPYIDIDKINRLTDEVTEGRNIVDLKGSIPLSSLQGAREITLKFGKGIILEPCELNYLSKMLESVKRLKAFMNGMEDIAINISSYAMSMYELDDLTLEIRRCINLDMVDDKASKELNKVRKRKNIVELRIKDKLNSLIAYGHKNEYMQDFFISKKNGKYVIPVKREHKNQIEGDIIGSSTKGSTVYVEPAAVKKLREELEYLNFEEEKEVHRILVSLTNFVEGYRKEILINIEAMVQYDLIFAKAKYSKSIAANPVKLNLNGITVLKDAKHPLLGSEAVPMDFEIGKKFKVFVITGPNTGGKTVSIKTVGLLTLMVQCGLHIPCRIDSEVAVFSKIFVDIGDGQSIEQSLSTFSSHIKNISNILTNTDSNTMVIMDELGAGTDPTEGMGLAVSILEEFYNKGATIIATTHFSEIKTFAKEKTGFENGCMEFDINTLKPIYKLSIGKPGESNALIIAYKLGVPVNLVQRAHEISYNETVDYTKIGLGQNKIVEIESRQDVTLGANERNLSDIKYTKNNNIYIKGSNIKIHSPKTIPEATFNIGDFVNVEFMGKKGVVCETENSKGEIVIMIMKKKYRVNKKRVKKYIDSSDMYPDDYDLDVVLESKEDRKKKKKMSKKHVKGLFIERDKGL